MKRLIVITGILVAIVGIVTVAYFKILTPPGLRTDQIIRNIPSDAAFIFEYSNDDTFYDIFTGNDIFAAVASTEKINELDTLRKLLIDSTKLNKHFTGQNFFISLHPGAKAVEPDILVTVSFKKNFNFKEIEKIASTVDKNILVTPLTINGKNGYTIFFKSIQKDFYVLEKDHHIVSGSFSKELVEKSAKYGHTNKQLYTLLPAQQNSNALANLYINYQQVNNLFTSLFKNQTEIFNNIRQLPATAVLSLNYKTDALMFNGATQITPGTIESYVGLFKTQKPINNHLKSIFPATTAFFVNFAASDVNALTKALIQKQIKNTASKRSDVLLNQIHDETGLYFRTAFHESISNEFAVVTTRFEERLGIIAVKNGSTLLPLIMSISTPLGENRGRFNYTKLPYYLLGDAFDIFRKPYFIVIDNYLILANTNREISNYYDNYINGRFLTKNDEFNEFDNLISQKTNISAFINLKSSNQLFRRNLERNFYTQMQKDDSPWKNLYGVSFQLTADDKNFYTNFCVKLIETPTEDEQQTLNTPQP